MHLSLFILAGLDIQIINPAKTNKQNLQVNNYLSYKVRYKIIPKSTESVKIFSSHADTRLTFTESHAERQATWG